MARKAGSSQRRETALSREQIIEASIDLLDRNGESGLTFRTLSEQLATGPGAIYWHISSKGDLLTAACDAIMVHTVEACEVGASPEAAIRALALGMFDAMDEHPWVGSALNHAAGELPVVRILERIGHQVRLLGVPDREQWATACALLNYILGVGGQNAANAQFARAQGLDRANFLTSMATAWSQLDAVEYPFTRSVAGQMSAHDDRVDFLAGVDLILGGIKGTRG